MINTLGEIIRNHVEPAVEEDEENSIDGNSGVVENTNETDSEVPSETLDKGKSVSLPDVSTGDKTTVSSPYRDAILTLRGNDQDKTQHGNTGEKQTKIQGEFTQEKKDIYAANMKQNRPNNYLGNRLRADVNSNTFHQTQKIRPKELMKRNMSNRNMSQRSISYRGMSQRENFEDYRDDVFEEETNSSRYPHLRYDRQREHHKRHDSQGFQHTRDQLRKIKYVNKQKIAEQSKLFIYNVFKKYTVDDIYYLSNRERANGEFSITVSTPREFLQLLK